MLMTSYCRKPCLGGCITRKGFLDWKYILTFNFGIRRLKRMVTHLESNCTFSNVVVNLNFFI